MCFSILYLIGFNKTSWIRNWTMAFYHNKLWISWLSTIYVPNFNDTYVSSANTNCHLWLHRISIWPTSMGLHVHMHNCTILVAASNAIFVLQGHWHPKWYGIHLRWYSLQIHYQRTNLKHYTLADIFIAMELIPRRRLKKCINRDGFGIRKILILKWIVLGSVLTWGYKSTLLSTLVTIRYTKPIDTLADLDRSGLPLVMAAGLAEQQAFENDQREMMKRIYSRSILFQFNRQTQSKYETMY